MSAANRDIITGNIGEWSEIYVFFKLLADEKLYAADANLNHLKNTYYPIYEIKRCDENRVLKYIRESDNIRILNNETELLSIPISEFIEIS